MSFGDVFMLIIDYLRKSQDDIRHYEEKYMNYSLDRLGRRFFHVKTKEKLAIYKILKENLGGEEEVKRFLEDYR